MSTHNNLIINFLIPIFSLIVTTTVLGTLCLKKIKDKNHDILDSTSSNNNIATGIIMNNGGNIDKCMTNKEKEILASYYMKPSIDMRECCEDHVSRSIKTIFLKSILFFRR